MLSNNFHFYYWSSKRSFYFLVLVTNHASCVVTSEVLWSLDLHHQHLMITTLLNSLFFFLSFFCPYSHLLLIRGCCFHLASVRTSFSIHFWTWWGRIEINAHKIKVGSLSVRLFVVQPKSEFRRVKMWIWCWAEKHFITSNTSRKLSAQAVVSSSKNRRNLNKAAVRWKERNELNDDQPPHHSPTPHRTPVEGTSLISQDKWSLCSLLSFKGDIWRMGRWTDPSDENLQGRLQTGAVHCPGFPWKPLYMLNLLLCPDLTACW